MRYKIISHIDTIHDGHSMFLWTEALQESYKSTEKLMIWPEFHILSVKNRLRILFFSLAKHTEITVARQRNLSLKLQVPFFSEKYYFISFTCELCSPQIAHNWATQCTSKNSASWFSTFCRVCFGFDWNWSNTVSGLFWQWHASVDSSKGNMPIHLTRTSPIL